MQEVSLKFESYKFSISDDIECPLMVCSHERSGTHFLMNSIAHASGYTSNPFLDFDYHHIGAAINFFSPTHVAYFFKKINAIEHAGKPHCMNSLIKSHFPAPLIEEAMLDGLKVAYIFRDPYSVFISYWNLIHTLGWFEAPRTISPLDLATHVPAGRSQRYQIQNYSNYFERWAMHVSSAVELSKKFSNFQLVSYDDLLNNYQETIEKLFKLLSIKILNKPQKPAKYNNYVVGANHQPNNNQLKELKEFCTFEIKKYPCIPKELLA